MLRNRILRAGVGAIILAVVLGASVAGAYRHTYSGDPDLRYPGLWVGTVSPYGVDKHVVRWCWDGTGASWVSRTDVVEAADTWNYFVGQWVFFEDGGNCTGSNSTCDAGDPTDGKWRIYVRHDGTSSGTPAAKTCPNFDGQSGAGTGQITEEDMYINEDYVAAFDPSTRDQAEHLLILHEMGHMLGLDHPCGNPGATGSEYGCDGDYGDCDWATGLAVMCEWPGEQYNCFTPEHLATCQLPQADDIAGVRATYANQDGDACVGLEELGVWVQYGGGRSDQNQWDFFDVPVPALTSSSPNGTKNGAVTMTDVLAVQYYNGTYDNGPPNVNGVDYDTDWNGNGVEDGREYDRTANGDVSGPPNGVVSNPDSLVALNQVGDTCASAP